MESFPNLTSIDDGNANLALTEVGNIDTSTLKHQRRDYEFLIDNSES